MVQQQGKIVSQSNGKLYNFMKYKEKKPFFLNPMKITLDNQMKDTYYIVKNVVYNKKQILALKKEQDSKTIYLVEASIEDGQLMHISKLPYEYIGDISRMLEGTL